MGCEMREIHVNTMMRIIISYDNGAKCDATIKYYIGTEYEYGSNFSVGYSSENLTHKRKHRVSQEEWNPLPESHGPTALQEAKRHSTCSAAVLTKAEDGTSMVHTWF